MIYAVIGVVALSQRVLTCRLEYYGGFPRISDQVPAKTVFLTDGRSRRVCLGKREIILKHTSTRNMATAGTTSGLVIQALRWIGARHVDDQTLGILKSKLSKDDKHKLLDDARYAPAWVAGIMRRLAESGKD